MEKIERKKWKKKSITSTLVNTSPKYESFYGNRRCRSLLFKHLQWNSAEKYTWRDIRWWQCVCHLLEYSARSSTCCLHLFLFSFIDCEFISSSVRHSINSQHVQCSCVTMYMALHTVKSSCSFSVHSAHCFIKYIVVHTVMCALVCLSANFFLHHFVSCFLRR